MTGGKLSNDRPPSTKPTDDYLTELTEDFDLVPQATGLVIVDMQYATASWEAGLGRKAREEGTEDRVRWRFDRVDDVVIPALSRLLGYCRSEDVRIIYVTTGSETGDFQDVARHFRRTAQSTNNTTGAREHEIRDELRPEPGDVVINKTTISAFNSSGIESVLRALQLQNLLFAGVSTNMCVDSTARDAAERGFQCVIVEDCCSAAKPEYHAAALVTFQRLFGRVSTAAEVIAELATNSGRVSA